MCLKGRDEVGMIRDFLGVLTGFGGKMFIPLSPNMTPGTRFVDVVFVLFCFILCCYTLSPMEQLLGLPLILIDSNIANCGIRAT